MSAAGVVGGIKRRGRPKLYAAGCRQGTAYQATAEISMYDDALFGSFPFFDTYSVGNAHPYGDVLPRQQGMMAQYTPCGTTLHVLLHDCSTSDVLAFRTSGFRFGLVPLRGGYAWLMRDGVSSWDAPY